MATARVREEELQQRENREKAQIQFQFILILHSYSHPSEATAIPDDSVGEWHRVTQRHRAHIPQQPKIPLTSLEFPSDQRNAGSCCIPVPTHRDEQCPVLSKGFGIGLLFDRQHRSEK